MDDEILKLVAFIRISSYRTKALKELMDENKTPTQIAKDSGIRITHNISILIFTNINSKIGRAHV